MEICSLEKLESVFPYWLAIQLFGVLRLSVFKVKEGYFQDISCVPRPTSRM